MRFTYSRWSGSGNCNDLDADDVLEALSDDLLAEGNLDAALRRATRWGLRSQGRDDVAGTEALLQHVRAERQNQLERYDLDTVLRDMEEQLDEIVTAERRGIEERRQGLPAGGDGGGGMQAAVGAVMDRKSAFLDGLPRNAASRVTRLSEYEFLDGGARMQFGALAATLERHVLQQNFQQVEQSLHGISPADVDGFAAALHDLNGLLAAQAAGDEPDFESFLGEHGDHFLGAGSLDELVDSLRLQAEHTEALLRSMTATMREQLHALLQSVMRHDALRHEMGRLTEFLERSSPSSHGSRGYPFSGEESVTLDEALQLIRRMHDLDALERALEEATLDGHLDNVDGPLVRAHLGDEAWSGFQRLENMPGALERAGYIACRDGRYDLTTRGIRRIGQKALHDIFRNLKNDAFGEHAIALRGRGGDPSESTKSYEFGDPFLLDLHGTLMNSVQRSPSGSGIKLSIEDFEVFRLDHRAQASTVLMVDLSRSMPLRGCFVAAKRVALALNSLIRTQFPRDHLYVVGFSDYARQISPEALHGLTIGDGVYGTNMQHGFMLARRLLGRHTRESKQIILITDGEPTAHCEGSQVHVAYPPTPATFQETLREVKRCTTDGIVINTFMLARSPYLTDFVNHLTRINRGRAFFATPERLGDYVLVDYMAFRRSTVQ